VLAVFVGGPAEAALQRAVAREGAGRIDWSGGKLASDLWSLTIAWCRPSRACRIWWPTSHTSAMPCYACWTLRRGTSPLSPTLWRRAGGRTGVGARSRRAV